MNGERNRRIQDSNTVKKDFVVDTLQLEKSITIVKILLLRCKVLLGYN
jgi:hypothetical protein